MVAILDGLLDPVGNVVCNTIEVVTRRSTVEKPLNEVGLEKGGSAVNLAFYHHHSCRCGPGSGESKGLLKRGQGYLLTSVMFDLISGSGKGENLGIGIGNKCIRADDLI